MIPYRLDGKKIRPKNKRSKPFLWYRKLIIPLIVMVIITCIYYIVPAIDTVKIYQDKVYSYWHIPVQQIIIQGNNKISEKQLIQHSEIQLGSHILLLDLHVVQAKLQSLPWVKSVEISRILPHIIKINLVEEDPVAFYQQGENLWLINKDGKLLEKVSYRETEEMLLIKGANANMHYTKLWRDLSINQELIAEIIHLEFIGQRRWNIKLKSGTLIKLPENNIRDALSILSGLPVKEELLSLPTTVDLRLIPDKIYIKVCNK